MATTVKYRGELIDAAYGNIKPDLVLKGGRIVNVYTGEINKGDIVMKAHKIVGMYDEYDGKVNIDVSGKYILPGFIDGHIHVESSMLSLSEFARAIVPHGTTSALIDPHEFANVRGVDALKLFMKNSRRLPLDLFMNMPSCVPATNMETSGAEIDSNTVSTFIRKPKVVCLAEMMNFPGVINKDEEVLKKINAVRSAKKRVDGHCPLLTGKGLNAYIAAGINSDHESLSGEEALEKLRKGMYLMIREGSAGKDMKPIVSYLLKKKVRLGRTFFVSDDKHPHDIITKGHMDEILRMAIKLGLDPITAVRMVTLNTAKHFGMRGHGSLGIGKVANVVVVDSLKNFNVKLTVYRGKVVAKDGKLTAKLQPDEYDHATLNSVKLKKRFRAQDFMLEGNGSAKIIVAQDGSLVTGMKIVHMKELRIDTKNDILKIAVIERHRGKNNHSVGLIKGFGLKRGAIASTVAHDSHNIIVIGADEKDMAYAVNRLGELKGGIIAVSGNKVLAGLALPIAGLMSTESIETVNKKYEELHKAAAMLGTRMTSPFMTLSFMALPVIPALKITDKGLVDVEKFSFVKIVE